LVLLVERDQFEMGFAERDGQKFELLRWSEALAIRYATDNPDNAADFWQVAEILHDPDGAAARVRDHAAEMLAEGKPPMDEARRAWSRWASDDRLDAAAGSPRTTRRPRAWSCTNGSSTSRRRSSMCAASGRPRRSAGRDGSPTSTRACTGCSPVLHGRHVVRRPAGARPANAPADLRRRRHLKPEIGLSPDLTPASDEDQQPPSAGSGLRAPTGPSRLAAALRLAVVIRLVGDVRR
jgi:hypothetical protein